MALVPSCILYHSSSSAVTLLDIPRSIEHAQGALSSRLISSAPLDHPYPTVEPKSEKAKKNLGESTLDELLLEKYLDLALHEASRGLDSSGAWCLPRITSEDILPVFSEKKRKCLDQAVSSNASEGKRKCLDQAVSRNEGNDDSSTQKEEATHDEPRHLGNPLTDTIHYHNPHAKSLHITDGHCHAQIPPKSTVLQGDIASTINTFISTAPRFNFIVLDPPWPNRSARRNKSYGIAYGTSEISNLLSLLPIQAHLTDTGTVAVWVTNNSAFRDMLLGEGGLFEQWGLRFVEEWIWLKITSGGEPICPLDSRWRKPYEVLLVGRRFGEDRNEGDMENGEVKRRVIIGVPDLHSRKPNLKSIIEQVIGKGEGDYEALEIFARNLTAGWWCWGNEPLKFQMSEHWTDAEQVNRPL
jgi:N6-adenosine-specific RNA methylase IME4